MNQRVHVLAQCGSGGQTLPHDAPKMPAAQPSERLCRIELSSSSPAVYSSILIVVFFSIGPAVEVTDYLNAYCFGARACVSNW